MTRRWLRAPLLAVTLLFVLAVAAPVQAARNTLSNPTVSPLSGIPSTTFTYTVHYEGEPADSVTFSVAGRTVPMTRVSGSDSSGTFSGSTTLPVGTWPVMFSAVAHRNDDTLIGPTVTVTSGATPRPTIGPAPTPAATQPPAATPIPTPPPPPITATPLPPTPLPSLTPSPVGSPSASGFIGGFIRTPPPTPTPDAAPAVEEPGVGDEMWTLVTGGLIALSALALLGLVGILRARRPAAADGPIGPAQYRPPTSDE